ncbi:MAG: FAD-binding protein [Clostridiales Family XIII bacterium]|nr:FAD-binding protein [Clostridiales Family XIII bacterium]
MENTISTDVLVIGGGGAAVTAAVSAAALGADVILASKEPIGYGDTRISMGMIANPCMKEDDSEKEFCNDLLECGEHLNNPEIAWILAKKAHRAREISEGFGHLFQRDKDGLIGPGVAFFSGGHSKARTLRSPPSNGIGIGNALRAAAVRSGVRVLEETAAHKLLKDGDRVNGAVCYDLARGGAIIISAGAVILATGGAGWLYYPHTDCMSGACGDGYSLAYEAGAELTDMEQVQFVPFALTHPAPLCGIFFGDPASAGPAGVIRNAHGEAVLHNVHNRTRAQVTGLMSELLSRGEGTEHGGLLLDLSANLLTEDGRRMWETRNRLGQFDAVRAAYGEKAYRWEESLDVAPTAHYNMGGVKVDTETQSSVKGLFAAGQVMGGVFGGDRLGSASLTEVFVFGEIAGQEAARAAKGARPARPADAKRAAGELTGLIGRCGKYTPIQLKRRLQDVMWNKVGILRYETGMKEALAEFALIEAQARDIRTCASRTFNRDALDVIELRHMLRCALMITRSALTRRETRGAHLRPDCPNRDDENFARNITVRESDGEMKISKPETGKCHG